MLEGVTKVIRYSAGERDADGIVHLFSVAASLAGLIGLIAIAMRMAWVPATAALIYGGGLLASFLTSALYNGSRDRARRSRLRVLDHAMIYVLIAATYTPLAVALGTAGTGLLAAVWAIAALGIVLKLAFPARLEAVGLMLYLGMGWLFIALIGPLRALLPLPGMQLLLTGSVLYSLGVPIHLTARLPFHNAIWHGFVLAGAATHYAAIVGYALAAV